MDTHIDFNVLPRKTEIGKLKVSTVAIILNFKTDLDLSDFDCELYMIIVS